MSQQIPNIVSKTWLMSHKYKVLTTSWNININPDKLNMIVVNSKRPIILKTHLMLSIKICNNKICNKMSNSNYTNYVMSFNNLSAFRSWHTPPSPVEKEEAPASFRCPGRGDKWTVSISSCRYVCIISTIEVDALQSGHYWGSPIIDVWWTLILGITEVPHI